MFNLDSALGVEIQANTLSLASVKKGFQDYTLKGHLLIEGFRELSQTELYSRVQHFIKGNGFNRENVVLGLPRDQVVIRQVEFPIEVEENLEQVVTRQAEKFEPTEEKLSHIDFLVVRRDETTRRILLQIVLVKKEILDGYLKLMGELGLYPAAIRYSSVGLQGALFCHRDGYPRKKPVLIIRVDSQNPVEIAVATERKQLFSQTLQLSDDELSVDRILEEAGSFLPRIQVETEEFERLYLCGNLASELAGPFRERLKECEILAEGLELHQKASQKRLGRLVPAVGLAVSGINRFDSARLNLIPEEKRLVGTSPSLIATYVLGGLLIIAAISWLTHGYFQKRELLDQINAQVEALQTDVDVAFNSRDQVAAQQQELQELQSMMTGRQEILLVLRDLTERIPDDTYLQNFQMQGNDITMQGYSDKASSLVPLLLESPHLASVKTNWITQDPRMAGKERFNFAAKAKEEEEVE